MLCLSSTRYAVIAFGCASCPKITCGREGCGTEFCYHCKQLWHPNQTCDAARQQRAQSLRLRTVRSSSLSYSQESGAAGWLTEHTHSSSQLHYCWFALCFFCIYRMHVHQITHTSLALYYRLYDYMKYITTITTGVVMLHCLNGRRIGDNVSAAEVRIQTFIMCMIMYCYYVLSRRITSQ